MIYPAVYQQLSISTILFLRNIRAKELLKLGFLVRAFVRNPNNPKAQELKREGAEIFTGDIEDIRDVRNALTDIKRASFVPTYPNVLFQGATFATAAEEMALEHVVLLTQWLSSNVHPSIYTKEHWLVDNIFKRSTTVKWTILNPGLFAVSYFFNIEPTAQFGMMPEFGKNAPPSNEDIGSVAAHILKNPSLHENKTYRITGPEVLSSQQMGDIIGKILGRNIKVQNLPEKMMLKVFKAAGNYPVSDVSQLRHYVSEAQTDTFALGGPTDVVKEITGKEAEDFETIARRYLGAIPAAKQSLGNKLRAVKNMLKALLTKPLDMIEYEKQQGFPIFENMMLSSQSDEWRTAHNV